MTFEFELNKLISTSAALFAIVCASSLYLNPNTLSLDPNNNLIIITGCDSGFGYATSVELNNRGFKVLSLCLTNNGVKSLEGKVLKAVRVDVTKDDDLDSMSHLIHTILFENNLKLWAVVNNAGVGIGGYIDWLPMSVFKQSFDVNYFGIVAMVNQTLPFLKRNRDSRIINISSVAGLNGFAAFAAYSSSKFAVEGYAKCLRMELKPWDIHVSNINPGFMGTSFINHSLEVSQKIFQSAPKDKLTQYPSNIIKKSMEDLLVVIENPSIVVDMIVQSMYKKYLPLNNYPGYGANICRLALLLPHWLLEMLLPKAVGPLPEVKASMRK